MRFTFFYHQIIGGKKSYTNNNKEQSTDNKADICVEKATNNERGNDAETIVQNTEVVSVWLLF
jgi:hypothetical protein